MRVIEWKRKACAGCGRIRDTYGDRCVPCRQPADRRQLVEHGVPCTTADGMAQFGQRLVDSGKPMAEVEEILGILHPNVMQNVRISKRGFFQLKDKKLIWLRRNTWVVGTSKYSLNY